jgi:hypothetical protein
VPDLPDELPYRVVNQSVCRSAKTVGRAGSSVGQFFGPEQSKRPSTFAKIGSKKQSDEEAVRFAVRADAIVKHH